MVAQDEPEYDDGESLGFGRARIGPVVLDFAVGIDPGALERAFPAPSIPAPASTDTEALERFWARSALARVDAVEGAVHQANPDVEVRLTAELQGRTDGGGGGGIEGELLRILVGDDPLGRVADLVALGVAIRGFKKWLEDRTGARVEISDGVALLVASEALQQETGATDSTVAFVTVVPPKAVDELGYIDGYVVGLRSDNALHIFVVSATGSVVSAGVWPIEMRPPASEILES
jgi:hypothetical protein